MERAQEKSITCVHRHRELEAQANPGTLLLSVQLTPSLVLGSLHPH